MRSGLITMRDRVILHDWLFEVCFDDAVHPTPPMEYLFDTDDRREIFHRACRLCDIAITRAAAVFIRREYQLLGVASIFLAVRVFLRRFDLRYREVVAWNRRGLELVFYTDDAFFRKELEEMIARVERLLRPVDLLSTTIFDIAKAYAPNDTTSRRHLDLVMLHPISFRRDPYDLAIAICRYVIDRQRDDVDDLNDLYDRTYDAREMCRTESSCFDRYEAMIAMFT